MPPPGPPPAPAQAPIRVQRRVASNGVIMVAGQLIALGRTHAGKVVTVEVTETSLSIDLGDDITTAVVEPEALAVLQHSDPTVVHRDVLVHA